MRLRSLLGHLLVGSIVLGACFKGGGGPPPSNQAEPARGIDYRAIVADPLGFLPIDSEAVLGLDVDQVRRSPVWQLVEPRLTGTSELVDFKSRCGFDPSATIRSTTVGARHLGDDARVDAVLVVRGVDRGRLMSCMARIAKDTPSVVVDHEFVRIQGAGTTPSVVFAFVDASTAVVHVNAQATKQTLRARLEAGAPLRRSPAFKELLQQLDLEATAWGALNSTSELFDQASALGARPRALFGSMSLASGFAGTVRLRLDSPQQAQSIAGMAQGQIGMARGFFDKLEVTAEATDVLVVAAMTDQQLSNLLGMFGGMFGGP